MVFHTQMNGAIRVNPMDSWHLFAFCVGKSIFFFYRIIYPALETSLAKSLMIFIVSDLITSYILAFVFQVNHVIPHAKWPVMDKKTGKVNMDWAEMQVRTTLDYAHDSWMTTFLTGALNYQVTHHLVPYISQIHYPEIAPIIRAHCKKYDITYNVLPTFQDALKEHLNYLKVMGHAHSDY
jgi:fatty acid desaturase